MRMRMMTMRMMMMSHDLATTANGKPLNIRAASRLAGVRLLSLPDAHSHACA